MRPLDPLKHANILKAIFTIVGRQGLTGINISGISKEAGVGVGSLYTYFKSKEELVQAAYREVEHNLAAKMYERFNLGLPIKESLKSIFMNALHYRLRHYNETVFIDEYIRSAYVQLNFEQQVHEFEVHNSPFYQLIKKGQEEGILILLPPYMMINFINGAIRSCTNSITQKLIPLKKQTFEDCFQLAWKGIAV